MELTTIKLYSTLLSYFASIVLIIQWFAARRKYRADELLKDDYGILLFAIGWFIWAIQGSIYLYAGDDMQIPPINIILSILNNFCFLLAYQYLEYASSRPFKRGFLKRIETDENWLAFSAVLCSIVLFFCSTVIMLLVAVGKKIEVAKLHEQIMVYAAPADVLLSSFVFFLLWKGLKKTYWAREDYLSEKLTTITLFLIITYQVIIVAGEIFIDSISYKSSFDLFVLNLSLIWHFLFLICLYPLCDSWINEKRLLPDPQKMKIHFLRGQKSNWDITLTINSDFKDEKISFTYVQFKVLLELAIDRKDRGNDAWIKLPEHKAKALIRSNGDGGVLLRITHSIMGKEQNLSIDEIRQKIQSGNPKTLNYEARLKEALRLKLINKHPKNKTTRLRIPANNIYLGDENLIMDLTQHLTSLNGIDKRELERIIQSLKLNINSKINSNNSVNN
ncbi:MAG: hypothetical protein AAF587_33835 [Bacteroidota bacterium]